MKITTFLLFIFMMQVSARGLAQKITMSQNGVSVERLLLEITKQTGYNVFYPDAKINKARKLDVNFNNTPLADVLKFVFKDQQISYVIEEKNILISEKKKTITEKIENFFLDIEVRGKVVDSERKGLPGATITIKGSTRVIKTNDKGEFLIKNVDEKSILLFSYIGYKTRTLTAVKDLGMVILEEDEGSLKEVTVNTGLFIRKAESFTGAVATFNAVDLKRVGNINVLQSLALLDPSFVIVDNLDFGSDPNKLPEIVLRGSSGIPDLNSQYQNAPNLPLFILDGFEASVQRIYDLNINLIASVTLLKDASAKAIYGSKAGNGVVVIETKRPQGGKLSISYSGSLDVTAPDLSSYHMTNSLQKIQAEVLSDRYNSPFPETQYQLDKLYASNLELALKGVDTYWLSQPLQNGIGQRHNLVLDGGDAMRYSAGLNYNNVTGVMKGSDRRTISGNVNLMYRKNNFSFTNSLTIDQNKAVNSRYGDFANYSKMNPYWKINDENGKLIKSYDVDQGTKIFNPLYDASLNSKDNTGYTNITENFYAEMEVVKNLRLTARVGISSQNNNSEYFLPANATKYANIDVNSTEYLNRGEFTINNGKINTLNSDAGVAYSFQAGKNQVFANLLYSVQQSSISSNGMTMVGFPNDKLDDISLGAAYRTGSKATGNEGTTRNLGVTSAVNYSYDNRFLADFSLRANASSQFGANKRWGDFWSMGVGWNIHHEKFMQSLGFIRQLKLRGSVGTSGTQNFSAYQSIISYNYYTDVTYNGDLGLKLLALANPNLKWQQIFDKNIGLDANLFNKINLRFDYYIKDTKDLLADQTAAPSSGFSTYKENVGETRNQGFQVNINGRLFSNETQRTYVSLFANVAHNTNKIVKVSDALKKLNELQDQLVTGIGGTNNPSSKPVTRFAEGQSMSAIWGVPSLGIDPTNGKEIFVKKDGSLSYIWNAADQAVLGDAMAKYNGTFGANIQVKGFTVNFAFQYKLGGQMYNGTLVDKVENASIYENVDIRLLQGRWKTPGQESFFKDIADKTITKPSSRFVQDNNELIFSSVNLGYDFSKMHFVKALKMNSLSATLNMNDLGRIGTVKTERGLSYPYARTMSLSLQANF